MHHKEKRMHLTKSAGFSIIAPPSPDCWRFLAHWQARSIMHSLFSPGASPPGVQKRVSLLNFPQHSPLQKELRAWASIGCFEPEGQVAEDWAPQQGWGGGRVLGELVLSHLLILVSWCTKTSTGKTGKNSQLIAWDVGPSQMHFCSQMFAEPWQKAIPLPAAGHMWSSKAGPLSPKDSNRKSPLTSGSGGVGLKEEVTGRN